MRHVLITDWDRSTRNKTVRLCFESIILTKHSVLCYGCCSTFSEFLVWIQHMIAEGRTTKSNKHIIFIDYFHHNFIANLNLSQMYWIFWLFFLNRTFVKSCKIQSTKRAFNAVVCHQNSTFTWTCLWIICGKQTVCLLVPIETWPNAKFQITSMTNCISNKTENIRNNPAKNSFTLTLHSALWTWYLHIHTYKRERGASEICSCESIWCKAVKSNDPKIVKTFETLNSQSVIWTDCDSRKFFFSCRQFIEAQRLFLAILGRKPIILLLEIFNFFFPETAQNEPPSPGKRRKIFYFHNKRSL